MMDNVFTYDKALEWADLEYVYVVVIEHYSHPDRKTLIDEDIEGPFRTAEEANAAAESAFNGHLTPREQARTHTFAALVHRDNLRDDLRNVWRMEEYGDDVPDWNAIGDTDTFPEAYDSDEEVEDE